MALYLPLFILAGALVLFYLAARDGERSLGAIGLLCPLAGIVALAAFMGLPDVALGAALSGAVAALGLAGGLTLLQRAEVPGAAVTPTTWALLVPAALAIFMVGMSGVVSVPGIASLAVLAVVILPVLAPRALRNAIGTPVPVMAELVQPSSADPSSAVIPQASPAPRRQSLELSTLLLPALIAVAVALLAGWGAVEGVIRLANLGRHSSAALLAATVLGPASVLPLMSRATACARDGDPSGALGSCITVSAGACLILPALAGMIYRLRFHTEAGFPITLWRVECVLLLVLSTLMVPLAAGRFIPTRRDGAILLGVYVIYLITSTMTGLRS